MISPSITIFTLLYSRPAIALNFVLLPEIFILYVFITLVRSATVHCTTSFSANWFDRPQKVCY
jgi:hypothetical protein